MSPSQVSALDEMILAFFLSFLQQQGARLNPEELDTAA